MVCDHVLKHREVVVKSSRTRKELEDKIEVVAHQRDTKSDLQKISYVCSVWLLLCVNLA